MLVPMQPKVYHIVHVDKLASIVADGWLWCDAETTRQNSPGTSIGMPHIKQRRLGLALKSHPDLHVGQCVPFYFCPRSVMLHRISVRNSDLTYRGGQAPIVHLEADLRQTVAWAGANRRRWAFTTSNAGSFYFEGLRRSERFGQGRLERGASLLLGRRQRGKAGGIPTGTLLPLGVGIPHRSVFQRNAGPSSAGAGGVQSSTERQSRTKLVLLIYREEGAA